MQTSSSGETPAAPSSVWNQLLFPLNTNNADTNTRPPAQSTGSTHSKNAARDIATLAGEDTDLRRVLEQVVAQQGPHHLFTEDQVVDYQLVQFPAYGTNQVTSSTSAFGGGDVGGDSWSPKGADHWLQWMGAGTTGTADEHKSQQHPIDEAYWNDHSENGPSEYYFGDDAFHQMVNEYEYRGATRDFHNDAEENNNMHSTPKPSKSRDDSVRSSKKDRSNESMRQRLRDSRRDAEWDPAEQVLWKEQTSLDRDSNEASLTEKNTIAEAEHAWISGDKQHWMPDVLCKQCYACEAPFTIIRRRHHCRLCGQVFCNSCSAFFLHKHRVCQMCFEHNAQKETPEPSTSNGQPGGGISTGLVSLSETTSPASKGNATSPTKISMAKISKEALEELTSHPPPPPPLPQASKLPPQSSLDPGHKHLGKCAAEHLEALARQLLRAHNLPVDPWTNQLLTLATKCCATVVPDVKKRADLLDIRPYVKVKCVPGGAAAKDCAYLSGVMFRKHVSHKRMAKELENPRILLIAGAVEFTRMEHRIASLETLFEQENAYMEILVGKILKVKPDLVLVGKAVSRRAQELLLEAGVVLVQHVKAILMARIARQTGATVLTNHVNQFGPNVLGSCRRFRLVTFRNNELWTESSENVAENGKIKSIPQLLADPNLSNHERQAALAANRLGQGVIDGAEAVKRGLAKRGVAHTYVLLEGCPKDLGCTVVLRGAPLATLKKLKSVFKFLAGAAYSMHLEITFLRERGVRLDPNFKVVPSNTWSTSLGVDYGKPPEGRSIARPWNGTIEQQSQRIDPLNMTAMDHQAILITSVWMTDRTQCCPAEVKVR